MDSNEILATSFSLTDAAGRVYAKLSLVDGAPAFVLFDEQNRARLRVGLTAAGLPHLYLHGVPNAEPTLKIECDPLGGHVLLNNGGAQQSYLFLKNTGASGLVLFGANGQRQAELLIDPAAAPRWTLWNSTGQVVAASAPPA
jgi:hypothetical protein